MKDASNHDQAVELLQQLGLKEYEAKCLVALSRLPKATAKEISETSEVPRTRVYDAIRVLESKGLVEIQHSNPQQFRAVSIAEAGETLRQEYESRTETLVEALEDIEPAQSTTDEEITHEVWSLTGETAIHNRTQQLIAAAGEEIVLIIGREEVVTDELLEDLRTAQETRIRVLVGTSNEALRERIQEEIPGRSRLRLRVGMAEQFSYSGNRRYGHQQVVVDRPEHDSRQFGARNEYRRR